MDSKTTTIDERIQAVDSWNGQPFPEITRAIYEDLDKKNRMYIQVNHTTVLN